MVVMRRFGCARPRCKRYMWYVVLYLFTPFFAFVALHCCTKSYFIFRYKPCIPPLFGTSLQNIKCICCVVVCVKRKAEHAVAALQWFYSVLIVFCILILFISPSCEEATKRIEEKSCQYSFVHASLSVRYFVGMCTLLRQLLTFCVYLRRSRSVKQCLAFGTMRIVWDCSKRNANIFQKICM